MLGTNRSRRVAVGTIKRACREFRETRRPCFECRLYVALLYLYQSEYVDSKNGDIIKEGPKCRKPVSG